MKTCSKNVIDEQLEGLLGHTNPTFLSQHESTVVSFEKLVLPKQIEVMQLMAEHIQAPNSEVTPELLDRLIQKLNVGRVEVAAVLPLLRPLPHETKQAVAATNAVIAIVIESDCELRAIREFQRQQEEHQYAQPTPARSRYDPKMRRLP